MYVGRSEIGMPPFKGSITTTGSSEAVRLDKALFRQHPEFRQKAKVEAHVIGRGTLLLRVTDDAVEDPAEDPMVQAYLAFLERDALAHPERITPLSRELIERAQRVTEGVSVTDAEILPDDVSI
jgi:antitoxin PrlF